MNLKPTYYDVSVKRDPKMFEFLNMEVEHFNSTGTALKTFDEIEDFSKYFKDVVLFEINDIAKKFKKELQLQGRVDLDDDEILYTVKNNLPFDFMKVLMMDYVLMFNFILFQKKTFYFSKNLSNHLALTKLDAPSKFLSAPFECCLFVYDSPKIIDAFYKMIEGEIEKIISPINVFIIQADTSEGLRRLILLCIQADEHLNTHAYFKREILIKEEWSIEEALHTDWRDVFNITDEETEEEDIFFNEGLLFFRVVLNSLLYLGSNEIDIQEKLSPNKSLIEKYKRIKSNRKINKLANRLSNNSTLNYNLVGGNLPPIIVRKPSSSEKYISEYDSVLNYKKFLVRGHWRIQHYGKGNIETKLIWIMPYIKGPEFGEFINKQYKVS